MNSDYGFLEWTLSSEKFDALLSANVVASVLGATVAGILCHVIPINCVVLTSLVIGFVGGALIILAENYTMHMLALYMFGFGLGGFVVGGMLYIKEMFQEKLQFVMLSSFGVVYSFNFLLQRVISEKETVPLWFWR